MKLVRLKITDPQGFRSLQPGFEIHFRTEWSLSEEQPGFAPFVCAGPNGSGKSNLLQVLASIFYQLEVLRIRRRFLPDNFLYSPDLNPSGYKDGNGTPDGFELEYQITVPDEFSNSYSPEFAEVLVVKEPGKSPVLDWINKSEFESDEEPFITEREREFLLPEFVVGYSSGENQILSLPFFKMRFIQFDEYWNALKEQLPYPGKPEARMTFLDREFSQVILLCNLLYYGDELPRPFRAALGIDELKEFRIIINQRIIIDDDLGNDITESAVTEKMAAETGVLTHPTFSQNDITKKYEFTITSLLDGDESSSHIIPALKRCATCWYDNEETGTLYLDYHVNSATRGAFSENFEFETNKSPIALFQALQVLFTLNLYTVSKQIKTDVYGSDSLYVCETIPVLASDERIMRFKNFWISKKSVSEPILLKSFSDGEHQLLHSLGLCLLLKNTSSLFLLDEPETHFNPDWRSQFVTHLRDCFDESTNCREMFITTHTPFLISDSKPENVLVFNKDENGCVTITRPDYNTLGASINKITMKTFGKRETIGGYAETILNKIRDRLTNNESPDVLLDEVNVKLGDSVEKMLFVRQLLDAMENKE